MSGFGDKRQPRDTGNQRDTSRSTSPSGMSRLEQLRAEDNRRQAALLYSLRNTMETAMDSVDLGLRITDRDPHLLPTDNPRELARRAELYREQSERFMYSIPRTTLETLRDRFPGDRETYKKIRELCNKILSCRAYEDLPYITHDRLASEYTQARITVGKEEAREAAIELVSVLNTINMRRKATEGKASSYELREQVNNLHDAILGSSQQA